MKGVVRLLAMIALIAMIGAVAVPVLAESWQTRYGPNDITLNAKGTFVSNMQEDLRNEKYDITVTGTYNQATVNVVKLFQRDHGLTANGIFNTSTKIALWNERH